MTELVSQREMEIVTHNCPWCNKSSILTVDIAEFNAWRDGMKVQFAFPTMSAGDREMLLSGTHPECWEKMFAE